MKIYKLKQYFSHMDFFFNFSVVLHNKIAWPPKKITMNALLWPKSYTYIEVAQGDFFMKQKMWFELVMGQLAILKKMGLIMSNFWGGGGGGGHVFMGKFFLKFF